MTVINHMHTRSTSWKVSACPSGPEFLNLMLSKTDQDICASLPIDTVNRQQKETFTEATHNRKQGVILFPLTLNKATLTNLSTLFLFHVQLCGSTLTNKRMQHRKI